VASAAQASVHAISSQTERLATAVAAELDPRDRPYLPTEVDPGGAGQRHH